MFFLQLVLGLVCGWLRIINPQAFLFLSCRIICIACGMACIWGVFLFLLVCCPLHIGPVPWHSFLRILGLVFYTPFPLTPLRFCVPRLSSFLFFFFFYMDIDASERKCIEEVGLTLHPRGGKVYGRRPTVEDGRFIWGEEANYWA
jgi:hypothetical protein